jgi:phosphonate transport system substrate-binding protein
VIVRDDRPFRCFRDLRGRSWAYNEPHSQSGYGITRYRLASQGETNGFFGRVVEAGWHEQAIRMVQNGEVDASAIDSHVLAIALRDDPSLAQRIRVIDTLGPSPIQPVVVGTHLPGSLKDDLRTILLEMADDPHARDCLDEALVERFEPVTDESYDDIRRMTAIAESAGLLALR